MLSDCSFRVLTLLWLLASEDEEKQGNLPSLPDIAFRLRMDEKKITESLQELGAWIDYSDIKTISERYHDGPPETEEETETEERTNPVENKFRQKVIKEVQKIIGRPLNGNEISKINIIVDYPEQQVLKAIKEMKKRKGRSVNYLMTTLENMPEPKEHIGFLTVDEEDYQ
jgi:hypothetical protein